MIELHIEFEKKAGTARVQRQLMDLPRPHYENTVVADFVRDEIDDVAAFAFRQCENKEEVVPVQVLDHVLAPKQGLDIADPECLGDLWLRVGGLDLSDGDVLHKGWGDQS